MYFSNVLLTNCRLVVAICGMVKANAYGHGSIEISRYLKSIGVERLGVATVDEGLELRMANIPGPIHIMGMQIQYDNTHIYYTNIQLLYKGHKDIYTRECC